MSIVYNITVKSARLNAVVTALGANGSLTIGTSALSGATGVLTDIPLADPPATVTDDVLTLAGAPLSAPATDSGIAARAELRDGSGTTVASGLTVGTTGTDIIVTNTAIAVGNIVTVNSGTITHG